MHDTTPPPDEVPKEPIAAAPAEDDLIVVGAGLDLTDPNSPLAPFYFRTSHVVLVAFLALLFAAFTHVSLWHTDVWAHVRFGQEIVRHGLAHHELIQHEPFPETYVDKEVRYIHYQWIAQVSAYLLYETGAALAPPDADHRLGGGALLLVTAHALILVLRFLLLYKAFTRLTDSPPAALVGVVVVAVMSYFVHLLIMRPQIIGELFFAAVLLPLSRPAPSRRAVVLVPLLFLLWANCHGSFVMGFMLLAAVVTGRALEVTRDELQVTSGAGWATGLARHLSLVPRHLLHDVPFRRLAALTVLSVLATLVNPHGPALIYHSYATSQNPNISTMEEWKPVPLHSEVHVVFLTSVLLLVPLLRLSPRRFTPAQVLLLFGFGLQSVAHARMVVWWIMVFGWVAVPHLHAVAARYLRLRWLNDTSVPSLTKTVMALGLAAALFLWSRPGLWLAWGDAPAAAGRVRDVTPTHVLDQIQTLDAAGDLGALLSARGPLEAAALVPVLERPPHVVFSSETEGDYLLWQLGQDREGTPVKLYCYTHVHLFTKEHWDRCMHVKLVNRDWQEVLDEIGADYLVLEDDLYEQERHVSQGKAPGFSNLIDHVRAASDRWQVLSQPGQPVFVARRRPR